MSSNIILIEDRESYRSVLSLNLKVYVGATVYDFSNYDEFIGDFDKLVKGDIDLVLIQNKSGQDTKVEKVIEYLNGKDIDCPTIIIGNKEGEIKIDESLKVQPLLQTAAKILGVTAEKMATKTVPIYFPFESKYFLTLEQIPCDIFTEKDNDYKILLKEDEAVEAQSLKEMLANYAQLFVLATKRLIFVNSVTLQTQELLSKNISSVDLNAENIMVKGNGQEEDGNNLVAGEGQEQEGNNLVAGEGQEQDGNNLVAGEGIDEDEVFVASELVEENAEHLKALANELEEIANILVGGGVPEDIAEQAQVTITSMMSFAMQTNQVSSLIKNLKTSPASFRYRCTQLMVFLGMYVLREIGITKQEDIDDFCNAAFYHDLILPKEEMASVRDLKTLVNGGFSEEDMEIIRAHAANTAIALQGIPELGKRALQIIKEHHGNKEGKSFSNDLKGLDQLSRVFVILEHWSHMLLLTEASEDNDLKKYFNYFMKTYTGPIEEKIIRALFKLESLDIISGVTLDLTEEVERVKGNYTVDEEALLISGTPEEQEVINKIAGTSEKIEEVFSRIPGLKEEIKDEWMTVKFLGSSVEKERGLINNKLGQLEKEIAEKMESFQTGKNTKEFKDFIKGKIKAATEDISTNFKEEAESIIEKRDTKGRTKLMLAAMSGNLALVEHVLSIGADLNDRDKIGRSPIHFAAMSGNLKTMEKFIEIDEKGIRKADSKRRTPLFMACHGNFFEIAELLIKNGARADVATDGGVTLLMIAAHNGNIPMMELLLENKANLNKKDDKNKSAMNYAKMKKHKEAMDFLKSKGLT